MICAVYFIVNLINCKENQKINKYEETINTEFKA